MRPSSLRSYGLNHPPGPAPRPADRSRRFRGLTSVLAFVWIGLATPRFAITAEPRPAAPVLVASARSAAELIEQAERVLTTAGAEQRAVQLRQILTTLDGLNGLDHDRPLGFLVYLNVDVGEKRDPDLVAFIPVLKIEDLQASLGPIDKLKLVPGDNDGWWELRGGRNSIPVRLHNGYAFAAVRKELLADPLPAIADWITPHADFDLAVTLHTAGVPEDAIENVLADVHAQFAREAQRKPSESDGEHRFRLDLQNGLGWLVERGLRDVDHATLGLRLPLDGGRIEVDAELSMSPDTDLARAVAGVAAQTSFFHALHSADMPLAAVTTWTLAGGVQQAAVDAVATLRRDLERRMQQDGTANGPAAPPIRKILDALDASVAGGRFDGSLLFAGDRPGAMLLLAATRIESAQDVAAALEALLPLIAETEAVADLELDAVQVEGIDLHRVTLQAIRKQDEWLYGPDVGLYLGAGRNVMWLAVGGFEREMQIKELLARVPATNGAAPPLLQIDFRLTPWLAAGVGPGGKGPPWMGPARDAFPDGRDRVHLELTTGRDGLHLQAALDEGYIRLLGAAWRAKQRGAASIPAPNLAAPKKP